MISNESILHSKNFRLLEFFIREKNFKLNIFYKVPEKEEIKKYQGISSSSDENMLTLSILEVDGIFYYLLDNSE